MKVLRTCPRPFPWLRELECLVGVSSRENGKREIRDEFYCEGKEYSWRVNWGQGKVLLLTNISLKYIIPTEKQTDREYVAQ